MEMTINQYCEKNKNVNKRYFQRIIAQNKAVLLNNTYGVKSFRKVGNTYVLNVQKDFFKKD